MFWTEAIKNKFKMMMLNPSLVNMVTLMFIHSEKLLLSTYSVLSFFFFQNTIHSEMKVIIVLEKLTA